MLLLHSLEPFIILPYKDKQDIMFYSSNTMKNYFHLLKNLAYYELSNLIVKDNLIKVVGSFNYVVVFHIYPTNYREEHSGRGGQNLIIGYAIHKKELVQNFAVVISEIETFFDTIKESVNTYDIPTSFLISVNNDNELNILEKLDHCTKEINSILTKDYHSFCFLKYKVQMSSLKCLNIDRNVYFNSTLRLKYVYKYIILHSILNKEYWILVDCKDVAYYNFKHIHLINFVGNDTREIL